MAGSSRKFSGFCGWRTAGSAKLFAAQGRGRFELSRRGKLRERRGKISADPTIASPPPGPV